MRNKGFFIFLTTIVTLLCVYYLHFTFVSKNIQKQAIEFASDDQGVLNYYKKQKYLDSVWNVPVYNFLGIADFTYKEIKDTELSLGLDLQGGMHVTLEVSPGDILKGLSGKSADPAFNAALVEARARQSISQDPFVDLFYDAYTEKNPEAQLADIFSNYANKEKISGDASNDDVISFINDEVEDAINRSYIIIRTRIDQFGTSQPNIQRIENSGRIQVEIPGADNPQRIRDLLQDVAKLEFFTVVELNDAQLNQSVGAINSFLVKEQQAKAPAQLEDGTTTAASEDLSALEADNDETDSLAVEPAVSTEDSAAQAKAAMDSILNTQVSPLFLLTKSQGGLVYDAKDTSKINAIFRRAEIRKMLPRNVKVLWDAKAKKAQDASVTEQQELYELYFVREERGGKAGLTGEVITDARPDIGERGEFAVSMGMSPAGAKRWKKMTAENIGNRIAVVLDNRVFSAPVVNQEIPNGRSIISGNFTQLETMDLANILKAGSLPAPTRIVEEGIVGPTLGKVAQNQGITSILVGLSIVVLFMVFYYAKGGLVANVALLFNILFILGILAQRNASLTLPGIAGIVLTIGMSIDANVLIFERIREELRNGSGKLQAISIGYKKAFWTIFDSNFTTLLTAIILAFFGLGPVKGFAITLIIGIACSFFSAIYITRIIVEFMTRKGEDSKISFKTPFSSGLLSNLNFDFLSKRKIAYTVSSIVIVSGMVILFTTGLNLGVDFKGGRSYVVSFEAPVVASEIKTGLATHFDNKGTEVKTFGSDNVIKVTTAYLDEDESDEADKKVNAALISGIQETTGKEFILDDSKVDAEHFTISSSSKVGPTIADDIKSSSVKAAVIAIIAIFLYILMRFRKWQFSTGAIIALLHDSLFVFSAFAFAGVLGIQFEIDQVFVAAILTIIGYSINDTVVVFDRIRENLGNSVSASNEKVFNGAINMTLNRTLITSVTTLIVVLVLLVTGGEVLRGFSFALFVGVLVGTYSSVFIAAPIVVDLDKRSEKKK